MELRQHEREDQLQNEAMRSAPENSVLLNREEVRTRKRRYRLFKRVQDVVFSAAALLLLWPVMLIVAIVIVIDSPGAGPIFAQKRVGIDGKEFTFYKFRSMKPDAEDMLPQLLPLNEMKGPVFKIKDDPRITRVGRFIRKSSIDELPQLLNVLRGDMSLVGPRPALPREVAQYGDYEKQRLLVLPGLTCFWQIQPHRNDLSFEQWLELDLKYIRERNTLVDWKILVKTVSAVLSMDGI